MTSQRHENSLLVPAAAPRGDNEQLLLHLPDRPEGGRGPFKIGISTRPENRAKQLQTAHPRPVAVHGSWRHSSPRAVEAETHRLLAPWHMSGEWFDVSRNRTTTAIMQAIIHVDSKNQREINHDTLASMRDIIMPNAARTSGATKDLFRVGYARHVFGWDPSLDLACQAAWLEAYGVLDADMYIETDPKVNSTLWRDFRELRNGDRFLVLSREVLGGANHEEALFKIAKERGVTIQFMDEIVSYTKNGTTEVA
jgi:Meiotically up-regulated gene 113